MNDKPHVPDWVVIVVFVLTIVLSNLFSTWILTKAIEDSARATICVQLQGPQCPLLPTAPKQ